MKNPLKYFFIKRLSRLEEIQRLKNRVAELEYQIEIEQGAQACAEEFGNKQSLESDQSVAACENEKRMKLIKAIIKFRDQLLLFKDNAEDEGASKLLTNLYRETGRILSINGVEILNQGGDYFSDYQIVADTIATDQKELINTIEGTFRDGYIVDGKMLRPQEVIVYVQKS